MRKTTKKAKSEEKVEDVIIENVVETPVTDIKPEAEKAKSEEKEDDKLPENVKKLMMAHSEMKELYVSDRGFMFVEGTPAKVRGNAKLYKNIFYKQ